MRANLLGVLCADTRDVQALLHHAACRLHPGGTSVTQHLTPPSTGCAAPGRREVSLLRTTAAALLPPRQAITLVTCAAAALRWQLYTNGHPTMDIETAEPQGYLNGTHG